MSISPTSHTPQQEQLNQLRRLIPEAFSEGKLDIDKLTALLDDDNLVAPAREAYGLNWAGKRGVYTELKTPTTETLQPLPDESVDFDSTQNLFIEGDNLQVLKVLQKSYHHRIKMIYIDPPYNTGNDRFIYPDDYSETLADYRAKTGEHDEDGNLTHTDGMKANRKENGQYHSNWLNMMYPRLALAKNLLRDDGVIFVSIDDNEVANLRLLMDEIFGEENFVANVVWQRAFSPKNDAKYLSESHDYILIYAKSLSNFEVGRVSRSEKADERYKNLDNDSRGRWISSDLTVKTYSEKYDYPITLPSGDVIEPTEGRCWGVSQQKFAELVKDNRIWFGKSGSNVPRLKRFLSEVQEGMVATTLWTYSDVGHNQEGRQELKKVFDNKGLFDSPKPVRLIKQVITLANLNKNDIILDFFAGSSTTAHAVMDLNAEDGGQRQFIMVQLPEAIDEKDNKSAYEFCQNNGLPPTIAEISKERIRRAGKQIREEHPDTSADLGFKVYRLSESNFIPWQQPEQYDMTSLLAELEKQVNPIVNTASDDDIITELMLKEGYTLNDRIIKITVNDAQFYGINRQLMLDTVSKNDAPLANSEQRTANSEQRTANSEQRTANSEQRTANSEQRTVRILGRLVKMKGVTRLAVA